MCNYSFDSYVAFKLWHPVIKAERHKRASTCLEVLASTLDSGFHVVDRFGVSVAVQESSNTGSLAGKCFGYGAHFSKLAANSLVHDTFRIMMAGV